MNVILAMAAFVLSHVIISATGLKPALIKRFGERVYLAAYSVLSIVLLGWVIWAVIDAERIDVWSPPLWGYHFAAAVTGIGFLLIGIGALSPNPLSVAFRKTGFDPDRPGVVGWTRHPIVWGLALWGAAHVPANGDWPSLLLFAGSALFGAVGTGMVEKRMKRRHGLEVWQRLAAGRGHLDANAVKGALLGLALWLGFLLLHPVLFGPDPLAVLVG